MENKLKIILIMLLSTILGCNNKSETPYYIYNSEGYNKKIKEFKLSIEEANSIFARYFFEKFSEKGVFIAD